jgi:hypothetical protein
LNLIEHKVAIKQFKADLKCRTHFFLNLIKTKRAIKYFKADATLKTTSRFPFQTRIEHIGQWWGTTERVESGSYASTTGCFIIQETFQERRTQKFRQ